MSDLLPILQDRCTGHCCHGFTLPYSYDHLQNVTKKTSLEWIEYAKTHELNPDDLRQAKDNLMIAEMVIPLGTVTKKFIKETRTDRRPMDMIAKAFKRQRRFVYTCKNLDKKTGNCKVYDERPKMCRTFPDGTYCEFKKCTDKKWNLKHLLSQGKLTEFVPIYLVCRFRDKCLCIVAGKPINLKWSDFLERYLLEHKKPYKKSIGN